MSRRRDPREPRPPREPTSPPIPTPVPTPVPTSADAHASQVPPVDPLADPPPPWPELTVDERALLARVRDRVPWYHDPRAAADARHVLRVLDRLAASPRPSGAADDRAWRGRRAWLAEVETEDTPGEAWRPARLRLDVRVRDGADVRRVLARLTAALVVADAELDAPLGPTHDVRQEGP